MPIQADPRILRGVLDLDFVTPGLAVGACFGREAVARLAADHAIAHVVDLRAEACDDEAALQMHGIRLLHLPTEDTRALSQTQIRRGVEFVCEALDRGDRVLVHCQHGIGRSALLACCVLVERGAPPLTALEVVKRGRPVISPSPAQLAALALFSARIKSRRGAAWDAPEVQDLGAIAWRHLRFRGRRITLDEARAGSTLGSGEQ